MKKRLILATLLTLGVLVGCGNTSSSETPAPSSSETPVSSETVSSEAPSSSEEAVVTGWGTEAAPLTVAQAIEKMKDWTGSEWSETEGYVTGKIVSISKSKYDDYNAVLESALTGIETFEIYGAYLANGVVEPVAGSTVTVKGHFKKYIKTDKTSGETTAIKYEVAFDKTLEYRPYIIASDAVATTPEEPEETPVAGENSIQAYATANSWSNGTQYTSLTLNSGATVTVAPTTYNEQYGANTGKYYDGDLSWRMYQTEAPTITVSAPEGKELVSVKITYVSNKTGVLTLEGANVESASVVTASGTSIVFGVGNTDSSVTNGQVRITEIEVVLK